MTLNAVAATLPIGPTPVIESPAERFKRLAKARTNKALKAISLIKNLSNRNLYHYTGDQLEVIIGALVDEVESLQAAFEPKQPAAVRTIDFNELPHASV